MPSPATASDAAPFPLEPSVHVGRSGRSLWRVRDRRDFVALRRSRQRARRGPIAIAWAPGSQGEPPRLALAVGRRVGGAVTRNRLRRQLRAIMSEANAAPGAYLVTADAKAASVSYGELREMVVGAVEALGPSGR